MSLIQSLRSRINGRGELEDLVATQEEILEIQQDLKEDGVLKKTDWNTTAVTWENVEKTYSDVERYSDRLMEILGEIMESERNEILKGQRLNSLVSDTDDLNKECENILDSLSKELKESEEWIESQFERVDSGNPEARQTFTKNAEEHFRRMKNQTDRLLKLTGRILEGVENLEEARKDLERLEDPLKYERMILQDGSSMIESLQRELDILDGVLEQSDLPNSNVEELEAKLVNRREELERAGEIVEDQDQKHEETEDEIQELEEKIPKLEEELEIRVEEVDKAVKKTAETVGDLIDLVKKYHGQHKELDMRTVLNQSREMPDDIRELNARIDEIRSRLQN